MLGIVVVSLWIIFWFENDQSIIILQTNPSLDVSINQSVSINNRATIQSINPQSLSICSAKSSNWSTESCDQPINQSNSQLTLQSSNPSYALCCDQYCNYGWVYYQSIELLNCLASSGYLNIWYIINQPIAQWIEILCVRLSGDYSTNQAIRQRTNQSNHWWLSQSNSGPALLPIMFFEWW